MAVKLAAHDLKLSGAQRRRDSSASGRSDRARGCTSASGAAAFSAGRGFNCGAPASAFSRISEAYRSVLTAILALRAPAFSPCRRVSDDCAVVARARPSSGRPARWRPWPARMSSVLSVSGTSIGPFHSAPSKYTMLCSPDPVPIGERPRPACGRPGRSTPLGSAAIRGKLFSGPAALVRSLSGRASPAPSGPCARRLAVLPGRSETAALPPGRPRVRERLRALEAFHAHMCGPGKARRRLVSYAPKSLPHFDVGSFIRHPQAALGIVGDGAARLEVLAGGDGHGRIHANRAIHRQAAEVHVVVALVVGVPGDRHFAVGRGGNGRVPIAGFGEKDTIASLVNSSPSCAAARISRLLIAEPLPGHPDAPLGVGCRDRVHVRAGIAGEPHLIGPAAARPATSRRCRNCRPCWRTRKPRRASARPRRPPCASRPAWAPRPAPARSRCASTWNTQQENLVAARRPRQEIEVLRRLIESLRLPSTGRCARTPRS